MRGIKRKAFTLIEMIMVIVVLGVVAMIGTDIIAKMYQGYLRAEIVNELQQKTELALNQIATRLKYRIKKSATAKDANNTSVFKIVAEDTATAYNMLEWIGYDNEGFKGEFDTATNIFNPGWSGFIDLYDITAPDNTDTTQVSTKGSKLSFANRTIEALSEGNVSLSNLAEDPPALVFKRHLFGGTPKTFGLDPNSNDHNDTYPVRRIGEDVLRFTEVDTKRIIIEQYYLCWSAYALVPDINASDNDFNLTLHYNYQPWVNEKFDDANTKKIVIAEHVSTFIFTQTGNTMHIKLCIQDGNKTGTPIGFCKERAVF